MQSSFKVKHPLHPPSLIKKKNLTFFRSFNFRVARMGLRVFPDAVIHQVNCRPGIRDCDARDRRRRRYASSSASWHALLYPTSSLRRRNVTRAIPQRFASPPRRFKFSRRLLREQARASTQSRRRRFPGRSPSRRRRNAASRKRLQNAKATEITNIRMQKRSRVRVSNATRDSVPAAIHFIKFSI